MGAKDHRYRFIAVGIAVTSDLDANSGHAEHLDISVRLGTDTLVAFGGNLFTLCVGLPLQIYVSRSLGAHILGVYGLLDAAAATMAGLLGLGIGQTLLRFVPVYVERNEYDKVRAIVRTGVSILLSSCIVAYILVVLGVRWIVQFWPALALYKTEVLVMALMMPFNLILNFMLQALRGFRDIRYMVVGNSIVQLGVKAVGTILLFSLGFTLFGYVVATVVGSICAIAWMATGLWRKLKALPRANVERVPDDFREWRDYAAVNYAQSLMYTATTNLDRYLLGYFVGTGAVGILLVVRQLQTMPAVFNQMLAIVGTPMFAAAHAKGDTAEQSHLYHLITDWVVRASFPLVVILCIFAKPILAVFGPAFALGGEATLIVFVLCQFGHLAIGPAGGIVWMSGLERIALVWSVFQITLYGVLLIVLVPWLGLVGTAIAYAGGLLLVDTRTVLLIRSHLGIPWESRRFLGWIIPSVATISLCLILRAIGYSAGVFELAIDLVVAHVVFFGLNITLGLHEEEKEVLRSLLRRAGAVK